MIILVNGDRFDTMACAMAWAKRLGVQVEVRPDEWLERLRSKYEDECEWLKCDYEEGTICEFNGVICYTLEEAKEELARMPKYRPLGLYKVEM
jgi:hypothetical protein